jgi:DNA polymerase III epsilon subunit-like protein
MNFLIFDTETTGLPKRFYASWEALDNWPRMTQIGALLINEEGKELDRISSLIRPDGWEVPKEKFFIENNMSTERCMKEGLDVWHVLRQFQDMLKRADYKVAHNIAFDNPIIGSEMIRAGIAHQLFKYKKGVCTMKSTTNFVKIKSHAGGNKWPKLIELHRTLFGVDFVGAHDAMADVEATKNCFLECLNRNIIQLK